MSIRPAAVRVEGEKPARHPQRRHHLMTQYLLSVYQPDGPPPPSVDLAKIMTDLDLLNAEMKAAGVWVFTGGLHPPSTATVVRHKDGDLLTTDGPYTEGKEQ